MRLLVMIALLSIPSDLDLCIEKFSIYELYSSIYDGL